MIGENQGGALSEPPIFPAGEREGRSGEHPCLTIPFSTGLARVLSRQDLETCDAWQSAFSGKTKDHRFYEIVADTFGANFEHHYLALEDSAGKVRGIQPVFFVLQNLVEGIPALRGAVGKIREH